MIPSMLAIRLFIRLLLGLLLLSGGSKLAHLDRFRHGIQDYKLLPSALEKRWSLSTVLAYGFPIAEMLTGLGLISGALLVPASLLALLLFLAFSAAIAVNLARGRTDLSCHCGGAMGDHRISWWLVGRNGLLIASLLFLLFTPTDLLTIGTLLRSPSAVSTVVWVNTVLPVCLIAGVVLLVLVVLNAAKSLFHV